MSETIRDLLVKLGVDEGGSTAAVEKLDAGIDAVKSTALVAVGAVASFTAVLWTLTTGAANAADAALAGAQKTALGVEAYQELAYAASQSNLETSELEAALAKQTNTVAAAAAGNKTAVDTYKALGISQSDLAGLGTDKVFELTASKIAGMSDEQKKLQALQDIYGTTLAGKLLPIMNEGADGIAGLREEAQKLGLVIGEDDAQAAADFNDSLDSTWQVVLALRNEIGLKLLPIAQKVVTGIQDWIGANRELIDTKLEEWAKRITDGFELAWKTAIALDAVVQKTFGGWEPILGAAAAMVGAVLAALVYLKVSSVWAAITGAVEALGVAFGLSFGEVLLVVGAVVAAVVLLGLVVQDVWTYFQGGDSVLGRMLARFPALQGFVDGVRSAFTAIVPVARTWIGLLTTLGAAWYAVFSRTALPVIKLVGAAAIWLATEGFGAIGWWLTNVVTPALNLMAAAFEWIEQKAVGLQPILAALTGALDTVLGGASKLLGIDLTSGGGTTPTAPALATASTLTGSSVFGPTAGELGGGSTSTSSSSKSLTQNVTNNISGLGLDQDQVAAAIAKANTDSAAQAAAALDGATV